MTGPIDILNLSPSELGSLLADWGQPTFRARQILSWVFSKGATNFAEMTNLPQSLRAELDRRLRVGAGLVEDVSRTSDGLTAKYLFALDDGVRVEAVSMREGRRHAVCLSSQAGCAMGCAFCTTGTLGFARNLTGGEILLQALAIQRAEGRIGNMVFMGMGEPLLNLANVLKAIEALADERRFGLGARKITVSTCGIVPGMEALAGSPVPVRLALSLNSPFQEQRASLMPIARKYPLARVLDACEEYAHAAGRRMTLEYVLLRGVNTGRAAAKELARIATRLDGKVNLIEYNPGKGIAFVAPETRETLRFREWLEQDGLTVTIRFRRGREIGAGCGQLAGKARKLGE